MHPERIVSLFINLACTVSLIWLLFTENLTTSTRGFMLFLIGSLCVSSYRNYKNRTIPIIQNRKYFVLSFSAVILIIIVYSILNK